jgi:queuosine precursor transporter
MVAEAHSRQPETVSVRHIAMFIIAMTLTVLISNILVQFPVSGDLFGIALADILTWGAFTYPLAFLVTDLANRAYGPHFARRIVFAGCATALIAAVAVPPLLFAAGLTGFEPIAERLPRIAIASGIAFLVGQLLDVTVFNTMRRASWWKAPALASLVGSAADTLIFFALAFAAAFVVLGPQDPFASEAAPLLGAFAMEAPRWLSWAIGDFAVKLMIAAVALLPYRLLMDRLGVWNAEPRPVQN